LTPDKQEEFIEIANDVEEIISFVGLMKEHDGSIRGDEC
jgi:hypothetical protein